MTAETDANNPIPKITRDDEAAGSGDLVRENVERLKALFPQIVTDGKVDFDVLRQLLGDEVEEGEERYGLNWKGKRRARAFAMTPSLGTLRPAPEDSVDWDTTQNLMIEGDNLEVLKLLRRSYAGMVKLIYIDPPYNTGSDFVYPDNFNDSLGNYQRWTGEREDNGVALTSSLDGGGRFHSRWLNMIYPRLILAKELLHDEGIIFISIGEGELPHLQSIGKELFGSENLVGVAARVAKKSNNKGEFWAPNFDYIVAFAKSVTALRPFSGGVNEAAYDLIEEEGPRAGERYQLVRLYMSTIRNRNPEQRFWIECPDGTSVIPPGSTFPPERPNLGDGIWRWTKTKFENERDRIVVKRVRSSNLVSDTGNPAEWNVFTKTYLNDVIKNSTSKPNNLIEDYINQIASHEIKALKVPFDYPKPSALISYLIGICKLDSDAIVMDFFAGSGSTGHAVMSSNLSENAKRRYVLVQLPEVLDPDDANQKNAVDFCDALGNPRNLAELTKERLRRVGQKICSENPNAKVDTGFRVYKLATSNLKPWQPDPDNLEASILDAVDNVLPDRTEHDLLVELLLKTGIDLTMPEDRRTIAGQTVHALGGGALMVCLGNMGPDDAETLGQGMANWLDELDPTQTTIYFKDVGLGTDNNRSATKANLAAILRQRHGDRIAKIASI